MQPIYEPRGRALEYAPDALALNIYTGCTHWCRYCFAPDVLHKDKEVFHTHVDLRRDLVKSVKRQLDKGNFEGKSILLCFTCDPYPAGIDTTPTREVIKAIKEAGAHVRILTKGGKEAERDFDLLDNNDWFGITHTTTSYFKPHECEPNAAPERDRLILIQKAHMQGIRTWVSCEPVLCEEAVYSLIECAGYIDEFKIGRLNHYTLEQLGFPDIDWAAFGARCVELCEKYGRTYYLKADLRKAMGIAS